MWGFKEDLNEVVKFGFQNVNYLEICGLKKDEWSVTGQGVAEQGTC